MIKIKKSDFVRICKAMEMEPGECGVILTTAGVSTMYSGQVVVCPWKNVTDKSRQHIIAWSGTHCWHSPPFMVGILPLPANFRIEVEDD